MYIFAFMRSYRLSLILIVLGLSLFACRSIEETTYFQESQKNQKTDRRYPNLDPNKIKVPEYIAVIKPNDILSVYVSSLSPEASSYFNTFTPSESSTREDFYSTRSSVGYLVDAKGDIELPLIGKVKVGGLSTTAARDTLTRRLEQFLQSPSVRIYYENFRVILLGEVVRPGVYSVTNEKISIPEALGMAGDLTIFGNREMVQLIREENGERKYITVNLTGRDLFMAPYFYLNSNDIIYVPPVKGRVSQTENFWRIAPIVISTLTLLIVIGGYYFNN